ncbi:helix-turn-helix domain-containing protein [Agrococcus sp. TF02-05]|uniref:helix-turn-helix domain-containing protein n=1 Tax=Agrococcus sp. TF02-05 TaxID=2815211 RepID=UPI001AA0CF75|nr:helix-turn-helix domain-containing protein [Agrococcus sp. TF02-05]MBO1770468.1 helix-turn-helix domain-containing protein [Agrococcus sp. TF02-05]
MSVEAMAIALNHSKAEGAAKLVLLGIANHDGDGGAWPSVARLARYAHISPRNVQKALARLEELREIKREINAGGDRQTASHMRPNLYHFLLTCPVGCDGSRNHRMRNGQEPLPIEGVSPATGGVASDVGGVSPATPEPSTNPSQDIPSPTQAIAREALCDTTGQPHRWNRTYGWCADCGQERRAA